jgi:ferritin-like metal-binding protein YciE
MAIRAMTIASSTDIFFDQLKDLKSATEQRVDTLPDLIGWASDRQLRETLRGCLEGVQLTLQMILSIFREHSQAAGDDVCKAVAGLIDGGNNHIEMAADASVRDHLLIAHNLRLGHYLLAATTFTLGMAKSCGFQNEVERLSRILQQELAFTAKLGAIASSSFGVELGGES